METTIIKEYHDEPLDEDNVAEAVARYVEDGYKIHAVIPIQELGCCGSFTYKLVVSK